MIDELIACDAQRLRAKLRARMSRKTGPGVGAARDSQQRTQTLAAPKEVTQTLMRSP
jgi:hypothetical protein